VNRPLVSAILISLFVFAFLATAAYHWLMFGTSVSPESSIEASNYAVQTITTVGYGNWVPASWDPGNDKELQTRILYVKAVSVPFMLVGGSLFAVLVGIISNVLSRR
jgi:hypothetical protein